ncbi:MAG: GNAT family N-acetyltransferase [Euryarchaeota archaeon]|nr:GNAT family N-acetyltransferase [Euryarchaeota archaeon]
MHGMRIGYRDYETADLPHLLRVASGCWGPRFFPGDPRADADVAVHFVSMFIGEANRSRVAVCEGIPVGFILGRITGEPPWSLSARAQAETSAAAVRLRATGSCDDYLDFYEKVIGSYMDPLEQAGLALDSETLLLAVDPGMQGKGIGKGLLKEMERTMKEAGAADMFLVSTGFSDHGFYTSMGYDRILVSSAAAGRHGTVGVNYFRKLL